MARLIDMPPGAVATVRIIDTTTRIRRLAVKDVMEPPMSGFEYMQEVPAWAFLIETADGRTALFDLGTPKDWHQMAPKVVDAIHAYGWDVEVAKDTAEILVEHGVQLDDVGSIIWSHWHWDHLGNPATFPSSTELVVGPGFTEQFIPGFPTKPDAVHRDSDFAGRTVREISFTADGHELRLGDFLALDFFGDGSFYLLDTPGHTVGHMCGLARTSTGPDTFIFMGGDICHHGGELRPSRYVPLPRDIAPHPVATARQPTCPGALFEALQHARHRSATEPFFEPVMGTDLAEAKRSIYKAQEFDAGDHVLFVYAHDHTLRGAVDLFPDRANEWYAKGWRPKIFWKFLADFEGALHRDTEREILDGY